MTPTIHMVEQRSDEWFQLRSGRLTASDAHVLTMQGRSKGSESAARRDLRTRIALERVTNCAILSDYSNADMQRGRELEAEALSAYEGRSGQLVSAVGFVSVAELPIGCSPDGVVLLSGPDGMSDRIVGGVDVKCPRAANHLAYLRDPALLVKDYESQMAHTLLTTGAAWWDLCSYCPQFPAVSQTLIVRVHQVSGAVPFNPEWRGVAADIAAHELNIRQFLREVDAEEAEIRRLTGMEAA